MTSSSAQAVIADIVAANAILVREGVLDTFGHVSGRHPERPDRYFIARAVSPSNVTAEDIVELTLDGQPADGRDVQLYGERVIHGAIYQARPDVMAVTHHHSPAVAPFANSGVPVVPVFHVGSVIGATVPFWDSRDEFGDTNLLVATPDQGASLARALGEEWCVIMRRHGATVAGRSVREAVFRTIYLQQNAEVQLKAMALGGVSPLTPGEIAMAAELNLRPHILTRAWDNWCRGL